MERIIVLLTQCAFLLTGAVLTSLYFEPAVAAIAFAQAVICVCLSSYFDNALLKALVFCGGILTSIILPPFIIYLGLLLLCAHKKTFWYLSLAAFCCACLNYLLLPRQIYFTALFLILLGALFNCIYCVCCKYKEEIENIMQKVELDGLMWSQKKRALAAANDYEKRIAALNERSRIAREVHDNAGHMLSRAILQTGAIIATEHNADKKARLIGLSDTLKQTMDCVRASVHDLKEKSIDLKTEIKKIADEFTTLDCDINYSISDNAPSAVITCFAAAAREAFTNCLKHSNATRVNIAVEEHIAFYSFTFEDNGSATNTLANKHGIGLSNMHERAAAQGGTCTVSSQNGFLIRMWIPKREDL